MLPQCQIYKHMAEHESSIWAYFKTFSIKMFLLHNLPTGTSLLLSILLDWSYFHLKDNQKHPDATNNDPLVSLMLKDISET